MRTPKHALSLLASAALIVSVLPVQAQQADASAPAAQQQEQQQPQALTAQGQLLRVDATAKTIAIRTASGEMQFTYTDSTKVTGAGNSVAGLATMANASVTVTYAKQGQTNVASAIDVAKKE
jgi:hypothetical protein